jgi:hypothetical protein
MTADQPADGPTGHGQSPAVERARRRIRATARRIQTREAETAIERLRATADGGLDPAEEAAVRALAARIAGRLVAVPDAHLARAHDGDVGDTALALFGVESGEEAKRDETAEHPTTATGVGNGSEGDERREQSD